MLDHSKSVEVRPCSPKRPVRMALFGWAGLSAVFVAFTPVLQENALRFLGWGVGYSAWLAFVGVGWALAVPPKRRGLVCWGCVVCAVVLFGFAAVLYMTPGVLPRGSDTTKVVCVTALASISVVALSGWLRFVRPRRPTTCCS